MWIQRDAYIYTNILLLTWYVKWYGSIFVSDNWRQYCWYSINHTGRRDTHRSLLLFVTRRQSVECKHDMAFCEKRNDMMIGTIRRYVYITTLTEVPPPHADLFRCCLFWVWLHVVHVSGSRVGMVGYIFIQNKAKYEHNNKNLRWLAYR